MDYTNGVRPSSGAATSCPFPNRWELAAPEEGRTPL